MRAVIKSDLILGEQYGGLEFKLWDETLIGKPVTIVGTLRLPEMTTVWYRIAEDTHVFSHEMFDWSE